MNLGTRRLCTWQRRFGALPLSVYITVALITCAQAVDWPMHRGGPQLQGVAQMAAPTKAVLAWSFVAGAPIKGSAAIALARVYFGDDAGVLHALSVEQGKELWTFKAESSIEATPLVLAGVVYVGSADSNLYALDAVTGTLKWKYGTGGKIQGGATHARNPENTGDWILVGSYDTSLHCVDAATGKVVWTHATDNYINGTPALFKTGEIVFGGCDAAIHVLALKDGSELRHIDAEAYIASSVAIMDGLGYVGNYANYVLAFDPKAGAVTWKYRDRNFPYLSSAAVTAEYVVIGGGDKQLHCLDRATGRSVWKFQARKPIDSSPVVCGDAVVVGSGDGRLYCVGLMDGKERWAYEIGAALSGSPAVADGRIIIGAEDGTLYCFGAAAPGTP